MQGGEVMAYTISVRCGSQKSVCKSHNKRDEKTVQKELAKESKPHIKQERTKENLVFERDLGQVYNELFGQALEEWNEKQTKAERKIDDYLKHCQQSDRLQSEYEIIIQVGNAENKPSDKVAREILIKYANSFQKENPNLKITGCYLHMDEETPHLHIDYVAFCHSERGMKVQNSQSGAFREMGIESQNKKQTAQMEWQRKQEQKVASICSEYGFEIEQPRTHRKHEKQENYHIKQQNEELKTQNDVLQQNIAFTKQIAESYQGQIEQAKEEAKGWQDIIKEYEENAKERVEAYGSINEYEAFCQERDLKPVTFDLEV